MIFTGCSQNQVKNKEVPEFPPDNLLTSPCERMDTGNTIRSLGEAYTVNWYCIDAHEDNLALLRQWKLEKQQIYNTKNKEK